MALTEQEIIAKHIDALGQAKAECVWLSSQQDRDQAAPRGRHYEALKTALKACEGCCRQMNYYRGDTRWLRPGIFYAKIMRKTQQWYVAQKWGQFGAITGVFDKLHSDMEYLRSQRTGVLSTTPILPTAGNMDWTRVADWVNPWLGDHAKAN